MIHIVGLAGRASLPVDAPVRAGTVIVARSRHVTESLLRNAPEIDQAYDHLFDVEPVRHIAAQITSDLRKIDSASTSVTYLTPGLASCGDAIVEHILKECDAEIYPGVMASGLNSSQIQIVDALHLASAEEQQPFDAGIASLDSTQDVLITNWHGAEVCRLAQARIERVFPDFSPPASNEFSISVHGRDPLVGGRSMPALERIMAQLRSPDGCPWDREQTAVTLLESLEEEVGEVADAVRSGNIKNQIEELGDVLMHLVMLAQIGHERDEFGFEDVLDAISAKMVRRHPHVFAGLEISSMEELSANWEAIKLAEKAAE